MSFQQPSDPWSRLVAATRTASDDRETSAPYGFSTRVAALAFTSERRTGALFERFALRALAVASVLAIGSVALNYNAITVPQPTVAMASVNDTESIAPTDDAVALVLDFAAD